MNKNGFINIIIIGVIAIIIAAAGYFAMTRKIAEAPATTQEEEETTKDWKTYRNDGFNIELQYPNEWILEETEEINWPDKQAIRTGRKLFRLIGVYATSNPRCVIDIDYATGRGLGSDWILEDEKIIISGKEFDMRSFYSLTKDNLRSISIYNFPNSQYQLVIGGSPHYQTNINFNRIDGRCLSDFNQILSTFKFID